MSRIILLDAGPLGYALTPKVNETHRGCARWLRTLMANRESVAIAEIADYECRRGWLRTDNAEAIANLDRLKALLSYVPITTGAMLMAAELWARARKGGYATAGDESLDADVILAAQASLLAGGGQEVVVATTNVRHVARFVPAKKWEEIT